MPDQSPPSQRATRRQRRSALATPRFRAYFSASCFSTFATWITRFVLGWSAWEMTQSALWVGIVSAAMLLPTFILSPIFGVVSDRISARNGMLMTTTLQAVIVSAAALVAYKGSFTLAWLMVVSICVGAVSAAHHPLRLALIPKLVERENLASAVGLSAVVFNSSRILGPAAAAWLLANSSVALTFWVAAGLFGSAALFLTTVHSTPAETPAQGASLYGDLTAGLRFISRAPTIKLVLVLTLVNGLFGRSVIELLPAISGQLIGGDAGSLAVLTGCAGAGSIAGGMFVSRQPSQERRLFRLVLLAILSSGLVMLPIPVVEGLLFLSVIVMLLSMSMTMIGTGCQTLIQLMADDAFRGRILSIWTVVTMGAPALGAFALGAMADVAGFAPVLFTSALMTAAAASVFLARKG